MVGQQDGGGRSAGRRGIIGPGPDQRMGDGSDVVVRRETPNDPGFQTRGVTPAAYFILAFAIAVTVGIVLRNTAAAIGLTVAIYVVLLLLLGLARPHYAMPEQFRDSVPASGGQPANDADDSWQLDYYYLNATDEKVSPRTDGCQAEDGYQQCLVRQGVVGAVMQYQPADRFWRFQATEAALALAASAALFAAGLIRLRRHIT